MCCERYEQDLTAGAAGGAITPDLEAHLAGCAACRDRLAERQAALGRIDQMLTSHLDVEPSPALRRRVISGVARAESERRRMAPWAAAAALAAGLVMALLAGAFAPRPSVRPPESSSAGMVPGGPAATATQPNLPVILPSTPRAPATAAPHVVRRGPAPAITPGIAVREPEVLVPPGQEDALRRFFAGLRDGSAPAPGLLRAGASVEDSIAPAPLIEIPLLEAEPLASSVDSKESHS
jgi:hypothetical protein